MTENVVGKQKDAQGRTRFYILPVETEHGFQDLIKFVSQEFECEFGRLDEGPGTIVQKGTVEGKGFIFVLSDSTGVQFYPENEDDVAFAGRIARRVEARIREVM